MRNVDYPLADNHDRYGEQMYLDYFHAVFDGNSDESLVDTGAPTLEYQYPYIFSAIGISIARALNLSPVALVTLARFFNMIASVLIFPMTRVSYRCHFLLQDSAFILFIMKKKRMKIRLF